MIPALLVRLVALPWLALRELGGSYGALARRAWAVPALAGAITFVLLRLVVRPTDRLDWPALLGLAAGCQAVFLAVYAARGPPRPRAVPPPPRRAGRARAAEAARVNTLERDAPFAYGTQPPAGSPPPPPPGERIRLLRVRVHLAPRPVGAVLDPAGLPLHRDDVPRRGVAVHREAPAAARPRHAGARRHGVALRDAAHGARPRAAGGPLGHGVARGLHDRGPRLRALGVRAGPRLAGPDRPHDDHAVVLPRAGDRAHAAGARRHAPRVPARERPLPAAQLHGVPRTASTSSPWASRA